MLPDIKRVRIQYMNNDSDASVRDFLDSCLPDSLQSLTINYYTSTRIKASFYLPSIQTAFKKTTKENYICYFDCSKEEFEEIVKASHNTDRLVMNGLKMDSEQEFDFGGPDYKTSFLSLMYCGHSSYGNSWGSHEHRFENIVKGIKNCGLKDSLKTIDVYECEIGKAKASEILSKHGLGAITVVDDKILSQ
jgi:hypothetical protein